LFENVIEKFSGLVGRGYGTVGVDAVRVTGCLGSGGTPRT
jgi:hypothetical protein